MNNPFLRLNKTIPPLATPNGVVDLIYDSVNGTLAIREGVRVKPIGGGSGRPALTVANAAERLGLPLGNAEGNVIIQLDDFSGWLLYEGGTPSVSGDWISLASGTAGVSIIRSATPPSDTSVIWFDTESGTSLVWYVDAWVETSSGGATTISGARILEALQGSTVSLQGTIYENTSTVALASGVWAWNATYNSWVRHDGTTIGGVPIYLEDPMRVRGSVMALEADILSTVTFHELGRIPVTAAQAVAGKFLHVKGTLTGIFTSTADILGLKIVDAVSDPVDHDYGWVCVLDKTSTFARYEFNLLFEFSVAGPVLTVNIPVGDTLLFTKAGRTDGAVAVGFTGEEGVSSFSTIFEGPAATAQEIVVGFYIDSTGSATPGTLIFNADFQFDIY